MAKKNDNLILKLKKDILDKRAQLKSAERFSPVTNCSLTIDGERHNLNVLNDKDQLTNLIVRVNVYRMSAEDAGLASTFKLGGFTPDQWLTDLQTRLTISNRKQEEAKLKLMEDKLHNLLSTDKKVELEIEGIMAELAA
jgi:hypothetical protein